MLYQETSRDQGLRTKAKVKYRSQSSTRLDA